MSIHTTTCHCIWQWKSQAPGLSALYLFFESATYRHMLSTPRYKTYRITAQPDEGRSVVSRYEGFCRFITDEGASVTEV
jgi:hypothetical protein